MRQAILRTRCECQAVLSATLDESRHVLTAHAETRDGEILSAPANSIGAKGDHFDVGWLCSACGRNVMRSFHTGALLYRDVA